MISLKRIKRRIGAVAAATLLAFGVAVAGLLGLALALIPIGFGILAIELVRFRRWLRNA